MAVHHYTWLSITTHHYPSLHIAIHHCTSLSITKHHYPSLHITVHYYTSLSITTHHCPSLHITIHHYTLLSITKHHCPSLHITVDYGIASEDHCDQEPLWLCCFLGVHIRLSTRCKIKFTLRWTSVCKLFFSKITQPFSQKSHECALKLTDLWSTSLLLDLIYKFELIGTSLLALAKSIYYTVNWTTSQSKCTWDIDGHIQMRHFEILRYVTILTYINKFK